MGIEYFCHFIGRHILGTPAKCIAGAIYKLEMFHAHGKTDVDLAHQIAAIEPAIAMGFYILHDLAGSRLEVGVTIEFTFGRDLAQQ